MPSLQILSERASLVRRLGVILGTLSVVFYYCCLVLVRALLGRLDRACVDRYTRAMSRLLLRLVRMDLSVHGAIPDFNDGRRYLILCSHSSHYDIPASFVALPGSIRMLAKKELFRIPFLGPAMRAAEFPSIDRHNRRQAVGRNRPTTPCRVSSPAVSSLRAGCSGPLRRPAANSRSPRYRCGPRRARLG